MRQPRLRLAVLLCVAAVLAMLLWAQIDTTRALTITPNAIDFGDVTLESERGRQLTIRNRNQQPALVRIAADCDCVVLSQSELRIPSRSEATVDVSLNRMTGDRREQWYTFLESELEVTTVTEDGAHARSIPIRAKFFEPYAVDQAACQINGLATELEKQPIPFSAAVPEAGQPEIGQIPSFVESVEVNWNEEFTAGELLVTLKRDTPPGFHKGQIEMRLASPSETLSQPCLVALEARVHAPYHFHPGAAYLGGLLDVESETVTIEGIPGVDCSIISITSDSERIRLEQHDGASFMAHRTDDQAFGSQKSSIIHVAIDVEYTIDDIPLTVKENYPVYVTFENEGDTQ